MSNQYIIHFLSVVTDINIACDIHTHQSTIVGTLIEEQIATDGSISVGILRINLVTDTHKMLKEVSWEDGGFIGDPDSAHNISYRSNEVWGEYDAFGEKGGDAVITFNHALVGIYGEAK